MKKLRAFWIAFLSFLPLSASALIPLAIGGFAGLGLIAGYSVYRSAVPVDMADALSFFSACWSCQMFSDVMLSLSNMLGPVYSGIGAVTIPMAIVLTLVWVAWSIFANFAGIGGGKIEDNGGWALAAKFGTHAIKLGLVVILLAAPLPKIITSVAIEPIYTAGLSLTRIVDVTPYTAAGADSTDACIVATVADAASRVDEYANRDGVFSTKLRVNLACQISAFHQMTGLGMATGWTLLNMSFNYKHMHKLLWALPVFPNVPMFLVGLVITLVFLFALLPVPIFMLEIFVTLAIDLIMLPLTLLKWLFKDWKVIPGSDNIMRLVTDAVKNALGLATVGIFTVFGIMFMNAAFGTFNGQDTLARAFAENNGHLLAEGLTMNNGAILNIVLVGLFLAVFMNSIPALIKAMFQDVAIDYKWYEKMKSDTQKVYGNIQKWFKRETKEG